jgi:hypothetical protein
VCTFITYSIGLLERNTEEEKNYELLLGATGGKKNPKPKIRENIQTPPPPPHPPIPKFPNEICFAIEFITSRESQGFGRGVK